ncbi:hypothetical protein VTH06DRAFT_2937 [Thermothelomyces fergusii]
MTIQHTSGDFGVQLPAASAAPKHDQLHPLISAETRDGQSHKSALAGIKRAEVVFVLPEKGGKQGGYSIFSLSENPPADGDKPFVLNIVRCEQDDLADDLAGFVLSRDGSPPAHLSSPRDVHVVVSTGSGLRRAEAFYQEILRPLLAAAGLQPSGSGDAGGGYRVTVTKNASTIREFARELGADPRAGEEEKTTAAAPLVVLLSGDGGVVDLLNGLDHAAHPPPPTPTIALLPLGTGNALFHSLHKPRYPAAADGPGPSPLVLGLRTLFSPAAVAAPLPTFKASFSPGATLLSGPDFEDQQRENQNQNQNPAAAPVPVSHLVGAIVASYGFHASLVWESDTPAYRAHGDRRFGMAAAELLKVAHAYDATVEVVRPPRSRPQSQGGGDDDDDNDGLPSGLVAPPTGRGGSGSGSGRFGYVLATLVSNLERTFTVSPAGRPLDGRLRLVYFGDVGGDRTMQIMAAAYRGGAHVAMPDVGYAEVAGVRVTTAEDDPRWRKVCVDGCVVELEKGGWMRVATEEGAPPRLRVLVDAGIHG